MAAVKACVSCGGDGLRGIEDALRVKVPPGVSTGQKLKLTAKGNAARGTGDAGDLLVIVNVAEHDLFRRRGDDVLLDLPLTFAELVTGADVAVPTLDGVTTIRIPPASAPGRILRLGGRGLPRMGTASRGDLHVELTLDVPQGLNPAQADALTAWARALPSTSHPRRARCDRAVQERS